MGKYGPFSKPIVKKTVDGWALEVLGAPYGGHINGRDADGEYFSKQTDFMMDIGDERPVLYYHGADEFGQPTAHPEVIGRARASRRDEFGLWFEVTLDKAKSYAQRIYNAAINGLARASSGAIPHLTRRAADGELLTWAIGELTLLDRTDQRRPANELAVAQLKACFIEAEIEVPKMLLKSEELEGNIAYEDPLGKQIPKRRKDYVRRDQRRVFKS